MTDLRAKIRLLRALSIGHATHDRYGGDLTPGGCAYFAARTFSGLGAKTHLLTSVGSDFRFFDQLKSLTVWRSTEGKTTVFTNTYEPGQHRVQFVESQAPDIKFSLLPDPCESMDAVFIGPVLGEIPENRWAGHVEARIIAAGLQGFLKQGVDTAEQKRMVVKKSAAFDPSLLDRLDAVFLSDEDLELFGTGGLLETLRARVPFVAVTMGEKGCRIYHRNALLSHVGVFPVDAVDSTGAGDTFAAGTILALAVGEDPIQAARFGAACASVVVEARGGDSLPQIDQAFARFESIQAAE